MTTILRHQASFLKLQMQKSRTKWRGFSNFNSKYKN